MVVASLCQFRVHPLCPTPLLTELRETISQFLWKSSVAYQISSGLVFFFGPYRRDSSTKFYHVIYWYMFFFILQTKNFRSTPLREKRDAVKPPVSSEIIYQNYNPNIIYMNC